MDERRPYHTLTGLNICQSCDKIFEVIPRMTSFYMSVLFDPTALKTMAFYATSFKNKFLFFQILLTERMGSMLGDSLEEYD